MTRPKEADRHMMNGTRDLQQLQHVWHLRHARVPLRDGAWLSAALFYPAHLTGAIERGEAPPERLPALLEYHPYRKDDGSAARWAAHHAFARRGYVSVQLDVRGTGDSPGVAQDEYTQREHEDGYDAVEWLAAQPWCSGAVGMWGTSYAGFTAIQVAMLRPPSLRAIAPHAATDDRYASDVPYDGGCLMCLDALPYPLSQIALDALPPNPNHQDTPPNAPNPLNPFNRERRAEVDVDGKQGEEREGWVARWHERLGKEPWLLHWLRHQTRDQFWMQGSLRAGYDAIQCPTYLISGWHDGYVRATLRTFRELRRRGVPVKALIGPWTHSRPDESGVGPRIDFVGELTRWWDRWLKGIPNGIMDEPPLAAYVQDSHPPERYPKHMPGRWHFFTGWPPDSVEEQSLRLHTVSAPNPSVIPAHIPAHPTTGVHGPAWCPIEKPFGLGEDQRPDEARSLTFDFGPFDAGPARLTLLGSPEVVVFVASDAPVAFVVAKLSDVAPDGASTLITRAALNGTRRERPGVADPHAAPAPLAPGEVVELRLSMQDTAWRVAPGHRLRLSLSTSDWPLLWPAPSLASLSVYEDADHPSRLVLPVSMAETPSVPAEADTRDSVKTPSFLAEPAQPDQPETASSEAGVQTREVVENAEAGTVTVRVRDESTVRPHVDERVALHSALAVEATVRRSDPGRVRLVGTQRYLLERPEIRAGAVANVALESDTETLRATITLDVTRDGTPFFSHTWEETFPRHLL